MPSRYRPAVAKRRQPQPAYWEYLYISITVTAVCGMAAFALGSTVIGVLLLGAVVAEFLVVNVYKRRNDREGE